MGIPSYFNHIVKTKKDVLEMLEKNNNYNIDNFYLDCNSIIYNILPHIDYINKEDFEYKLIQNVCKDIKNYILLISPKKKVFIAFDGLAPFAKMKQQKERRLKSALEDDDSFPWSRCNITPGTPFMNKLDVALHYFFDDLDLNCIVIISSSQEDGEGEHKIFDYIRTNKSYHENTNTMIYGLDADLIMLCLSHLKLTNIYLFRETPYFIHSIDASLKPNENYILNIKNLSKHIENDMGSNIIDDYIFLCFLLGNDFLPHFPALNIRTNGIQILMESYKKKMNHKTLIKDNIIQWKNVRYLLEYLSKEEETNLKIEYKNREKMAKRMNPKSLLDIPLVERDEEELLNPNIRGWQKKYYKILFKNDDDEIRKKQISLNYIEGLEWTYKYYTEGCVNWKWKYNYCYPPLLEDLFKHIPYFNGDIIKENYEHMTKDEQLMYVIPSKYNSIVPHLMLSNEKYTFKWVYCRYNWERHIYFE